MAYEIKHLPPEEIQQLKPQFPNTEIEEYQVLDSECKVDGEPLCLGYYKTEAEARAAIQEMDQEDTVLDLFKTWLAEAELKTGLVREAIEAIIRECI